MPAVQLVILVLDASGSMSDPVANTPPGTTKAWQIEEMLCLPLSELWETAEDRQSLLATCGFIERLKRSERRDYIDLGIIRYDTRAEPYGKPLPITEWELSPPGTKLAPPQSKTDPRYMLDGKPFNLVEGKGGGTNIAEGLKAADDMARKWLQFQEQQPGNNEPFVTILLMSDMLHTEGLLHEPVQVAAKIKTTVELRGRPQVLLAAAAFGDDADLGLMRQIATPGPQEDPHRFAIQTTDPVKLREFLLKSGTSQLR